VGQMLSFQMLFSCQKWVSQIFDNTQTFLFVTALPDRVDFFRNKRKLKKILADFKEYYPVNLAWDSLKNSLFNHLLTILVTSAFASLLTIVSIYFIYFIYLILLFVCITMKNCEIKLLVTELFYQMSSSVSFPY